MTLNKLIARLRTFVPCLTCPLNLEFGNLNRSNANCLVSKSRVSRVRTSARAHTLQLRRPACARLAYPDARCRSFSHYFFIILSMFQMSKFAGAQQQRSTSDASSPRHLLSPASVWFNLFTPPNPDLHHSAPVRISKKSCTSTLPACICRPQSS